MKRICKQCGKEFEIAGSEIDFYRKKNLELPKRCKECRDLNRQKKNSDSSAAQPQNSLKQNAQNKSGLQKIVPYILSLIAVAAIALGVGLNQDFLSGGEDGGQNQNYSNDTLAVQNQENRQEGGGTEASASPEQENDSEVNPEQNQENDSEAAAIPVLENDGEANSGQQEGSSETPSVSTQENGQSYAFRNSELLNSHYEKHGIEMGFESAEAYAAAANEVIGNPASLHKLEKEDNDDVYYLEATNEFVIVSADGYIRTYFNPNGGIDYYNRQ